MLSDRLARRVTEDFGPAADEVAGRLDGLALPFLEDRPQETERVQVAVVLLARGDRDRFESLATLAEVDWRDVLVDADLADEDYADKIKRLLGSE